MIKSQRKPSRPDAPLTWPMPYAIVPPKAPARLQKATTHAILTALLLCGYHMQRKYTIPGKKPASNWQKLASDDVHGQYRTYYANQQSQSYDCGVILDTGETDRHATPGEKQEA